MVHLQPGAIPSRSDYYIVYIKSYNLINYLPSAHPDSGIVTNIQSTMYQDANDYLQAICYRFYLKQHSLAPNVPVQQLLSQVQYASYQSAWQPRWTCQHNQRNNADDSSAESEISFWKWTPHTDTFQHSPQVVCATYLQSSPCSEAFNDVIASSRHFSNLFIHSS